MQITKNELEKIYYENKNQIVCERLNISHPTLIKKLKENNIALKGKGAGNIKLTIIDKE